MWLTIYDLSFEIFNSQHPLEVDPQAFREGVGLRDLLQQTSRTCVPKKYGKNGSCACTHHCIIISHMMIFLQIAVWSRVVITRNYYIWSWRSMEWLVFQWIYQIHQDSIANDGHQTRHASLSHPFIIFTPCTVCRILNHVPPTWSTKLIVSSYTVFRQLLPVGRLLSNNFEHIFRW